MRNIVMFEEDADGNLVGQPTDDRIWATKDGRSIFLSKEDVEAMASCSVIIKNSIAVESLFLVKQQQALLDDMAIDEFEEVEEEELDQGACADDDVNHLLYEEVADDAKFCTYYVPDGLE